MSDFPPPVTSDCTLDDVEAYLDRRIAARAKKSPLPRSGADRAGDKEEDHEQE